MRKAAKPRKVRAYKANHRRIEGLIHAHLLEKEEGEAKNARFCRKAKKGARHEGHVFERKFGQLLTRKYLSEVGADAIKLGQWFSYRDRNGQGYCQTDAFIVLPDAILLFECKRTKTPNAYRQMRELYLPLLKRIYDRPVQMIQVAKYIKAHERKTRNLLTALPPLEELIAHTQAPSRKHIIQLERIVL